MKRYKREALIQRWEVLPFNLRLRIVFFTIVMLFLVLVGTYLPPTAHADGTDPMPLCRAKGCQPR
jgi:hypothetical protein